MKITIEDDNLMFQTKSINKMYSEAGSEMFELYREEEKTLADCKVEILLEYINIIEKQTHKNISYDYMIGMIRRLCDNAKEEA